MRKRVTATLLTGFALAAYGGEPSLELRLGAGDAIGPGFVAQASPESVLTLDVVLSDALAEIDLDTVDLDLNGNPIIGFARKSKTPAGIRLVLDRGRIRHPHLAMAGENRLRFAARDLDGNRYRGEFVVRVSQGVGGVQLPSGPDPPPAVLEASKPKALPPEIAIRSVVVELNWKQYERIQMRGGFPSRQRGDFRKAGSLPGSVTGDSQRLVLDIPVPLRKRGTRIELRATNLQGLEASESVTVRRP